MAFRFRPVFKMGFWSPSLKQLGIEYVHTILKPLPIVSRQLNEE